VSQVSAESTAALLAGRYQLIECVGSGGMATVYRAEDITLGRTVAIKVLQGTADGGSNRAARSETSVLASLSHPGLVTLFDAHLVPGEDDFLVMEYVDGPTLAERLREGPLSPVETARLGAELGEALHVVHGAGVVHRDVKPSNVLLCAPSAPGRTFRAKLADFGIAYLLGEARTTSPGMVVGTAAYLAPEQLRGAAPEPPADVYALGLVLLEALTGTRAFPGGSAAEVLAARHAGAVTIPGTVPADWAALIRRMTDVDPAARPSALDVALEASALATDARIPILPATLPLTEAPTTGEAATAPVTVEEARVAQAPRTERRRRAAILLPLAAVAAAALGVGVWATGTLESSPPAARIAGVPSLQKPAPAASDAPAPEQPAVVPPAPETVGNGNAGNGDGAKEQKDAANGAEEERKRAAEAAKQAEEAQKKAAEEERKQAEEAQKKAEEAPQPGEDDVAEE